MPSGRQLDFAVKTLCSLLLCSLQLYLCCSAASDYLMRTKGYSSMKVSIIQTRTYVRERGYGYDGFIPEFLEALKERQGIDNNYYIEEATDNQLGTMWQNRSWGPGLINDILRSSEVILGAGPILDRGNHTAFVSLSRPWAEVWLTMAVRNATGVRTLRDFNQKGLRPAVVSHSTEFQELERSKDRRIELTSLYERWLQYPTTYRSVEDGLEAVERRDVDGLILNSEDARYEISHHFCDLLLIEPIQLLGHYVFITKSDSLHLEKLNEAIQSMKNDNSLEHLRNIEVGIAKVCSGAERVQEAAAAWLPVLMTAFIAVVLAG